MSKQQRTLVLVGLVVVDHDVVDRLDVLSLLSRSRAIVVESAVDAGDLIRSFTKKVDVGQVAIMSLANISLSNISLASHVVLLLSVLREDGDQVLD